MPPACKTPDAFIHAKPCLSVGLFGESMTTVQEHATRGKLDKCPVLAICRICNQRHEWAPTDGLWNELADQLLEVTSCCISLHDFHHLFPDLPDLAALCIASPLDLALSLFGEAYAEHAQDIAVCSLHVHMGLYECLPFAHKRAQLVCGEVHALHTGWCSLPTKACQLAGTKS